MSKTRVINVKSLDFDGCIFNWEYLNYYAKKVRLISANNYFISRNVELMQEEKEPPNEVVLMVGSNRQSKSADKRDITGSCFPALIELTKNFRQRDWQKQRTYRFDPYLLADTYGERPFGENFVKSVKEQKDYPYSKYWFDDSKLALLYAQIHKIAAENPNAEVLFDFYDDRADILDGLETFFKNNADLMPKNLKLRLHRYMGSADIFNREVIQGAGEIDRNWQKNIFLISECAKLKYPDDFNQSKFGANILRAFSPHVEEFRKRRKLERSEDSEDEKYCTELETTIPWTQDLEQEAKQAVSHIQRIERQICQKLATEMQAFKARRNQHFARDDQARYNVLNDLHDEIKTISQEQQQVCRSNWKYTYRTKLTDAVEKSLRNPRLEKYDDLQQLGIALLNFITFVLLPLAGLKRCITGNWFFSVEGKPKEVVRETLCSIPALMRTHSIN